MDKLENSDEDCRITDEEMKEIKYFMDQFQYTIYAEIATSEAYIITEKRLSVDKLVNDVGSLMAPNIFDELSSIAQYDFQEACKCIAFERATAAAFHALRGIEGTLRIFFERITRTPSL